MVHILPGVHQGRWGVQVHHQLAWTLLLANANDNGAWMPVGSPALTAVAARQQQQQQRPHYHQQQSANGSMVINMLHQPLYSCTLGT